MKIRTLNDLVDLIDEDLSWRKMELVHFNTIVSKRDSPQRQPALRGAVALLYAHWEGFVKNACHWYLCYLASQSLTLNQLRPEIAALTLRGKIVQLEGAKRTSAHRELVRHLREEGGQRARIPTDRDAVRTESNLTFSVLEDILISIGCDPSVYELYRDLIDDQLVNSRNKIAHGEQEFIREPEWLDLYTQVIQIMDSISTQICNSAIQKSYLLDS